MSTRVIHPLVESLLDGVRDRVISDALRYGQTCREAHAYADAVTLYLGLAVTKLTERMNSLTTWETSGEKVRSLFTRQAIPMVWDYAEVNPFGPAGWDRVLDTLCQALEQLPPPDAMVGMAHHIDVASDAFQRLWDEETKKSSREATAHV